MPRPLGDKTNTLVSVTLGVRPSLFWCFDYFSPELMLLEFSVPGRFSDSRVGFLSYKDRADTTVCFALANVIIFVDKDDFRTVFSQSLPCLNEKKS